MSKPAFDNVANVLVAQVWGEQHLMQRSLACRAFASKIGESALVRPSGESSNRLFEVFGEWSVVLEGTKIDNPPSPEI